MAILLLLPGAGASAVPEATLVAHSLSVREGRVAGPLAGALWQALVPATDLPLDAWSLAADRAEAMLETTERPLVVADTSLLPNQDSAWPSSYRGLTAGFVAASTDARILVLPLVPASAPPAMLEGPMIVDAGPGSTLLHDRRASGDAGFEEDARHAVEVRPVPGSRAMVTVTGDLRVIITGFLLAVESDGGGGELDTRRKTDPIDPSGAAERRTSAEATFDLRGAVVTLPVDVLHLQDAMVRPTALALQGASGILVVEGEPYSLDGEDIEVGGAPVAGLERSGGRLAVTMRGHIDALAISGRTVTLPAPDSAPPVVAWALLVAFAAAAYVLAGRQVFRRIDKALGRKRYAEALALVRLLRLHPWLRQDAALAAALSLTELGRAEEARERLLSLGSWTPARLATRDFLLARAAARLGDRAETLRHLAASLLAEPTLLAQARADPLLAPVVGASTGVAQEAYA